MLKLYLALRNQFILERSGDYIYTIDMTTGRYSMYITNKAGFPVLFDSHSDLGRLRFKYEVLAKGGI